MTGESEVTYILNRTVRLIRNLRPSTP